MKYFPLIFWALLIIAAGGFSSTLAQNSQSLKSIRQNSCSPESRKSVREYFEELPEQEQFIAECMKTSRQDQLKTFGRLLPKISWDHSIAIRLVLPAYPRLAQTLKLSDQVFVEVICDENGKVIYSKVLKGHNLLRETALKAACRSKFVLVIYCNRQVKVKRIIVYNFHV